MYAELIEVHSRLYTLLPVIQLTVPVFAKPGALFRQRGCKDRPSSRRDDRYRLEVEGLVQG